MFIYKLELFTYFTEYLHTYKYMYIGEIAHREITRTSTGYEKHVSWQNGSTIDQWQSESGDPSTYLFQNKYVWKEIVSGEKKRDDTKGLQHIVQG